MLNTPKLNLAIFALYLLMAVGILIGALVSPSVRAIAYAPLRDVLLPPPQPVEITLLYSTEKAEWITEATQRFEQGRYRVNGRPIRVHLEKTGSREMYLAVLDGHAQPDIISPASMLQISLLEDLSARSPNFAQPVVNTNQRATCRPMVTSPVVIVAWEERAQALWGDHPGSEMWRDLYAALTHPQGWEAYGHPEWGYVKFGHTHPLKSNSGFQALLLMTYDYYQKTDGLASADILANPDYQQWLINFETTISKFGDSTGTYMNEIVAYGPSLYDFVVVYEATAIAQADNAVGRYGALRIYYPPTTSLSDHPFCILNAAWVTPEKAEAARLYLDFLNGPEMQTLALMRYGFRPVDQSVRLDQSGSPFLHYADNGILMEIPPEVAVPRGDVLQTLLDFWQRNIER